MSLKAAKAYASNNVQSGVVDSDPAHLVVLVFERALDHLKLGKAALEQDDYGIDHFTKVNDLIQKGLLACLDYSQGQDIAQNLAAIYEWSLREIIKGRVEKSPQKIQEVIDVLTPLYEGWLALADKEPVHFSNPKASVQSKGRASLSAA
jgi:flagellar secretion chaperone FliS